MMISLRRFTILMILIAEHYIFGTRAKVSVIVSVFLMICGAIVAASNDMAFNLKVLKSRVAICFISE